MNAGETDPHAWVFSALGDAALVVDDAGRIVEANARVLDVLGYEPEALLGQSVDTLVPEPMRAGHARLRAGFAAAPTLRAVGSGLELECLRADGKRFPADISLSPLTSPDGLLTIAVIRDMSERRRWEAERLARSVLDRSLDAYHVTDRRGVVTEWNRAAEAMFGWSRDEALGKDLAQLVIPERLRGAVAKEMIRDAYGHGDRDAVGRVTEGVGCRRDGREFPVEVAVIAVGEGDEVSLHAFVRDISERKNAEEQLASAVTEAVAAEEELMRAAVVVASTQDGIATLDLDLTILSWNPALERISGVPEAKALGRSLHSILSPDALEEIDEYLESALAGQAVSYVVQRRRKDGSVFTISERLQPFFDVNGTVAGLVADIRDVTEQEQAKAFARKSQQRLQSIIDNKGWAVDRLDADSTRQDFIDGVMRRFEWATGDGRTFHVERWIVHGTAAATGVPHDVHELQPPQDIASALQVASSLGWRLVDVGYVFVPGGNQSASAATTGTAGTTWGVYTFTSREPSSE